MQGVGSAARSALIGLVSSQTRATAPIPWHLPEVKRAVREMAHRSRLSRMKRGVVCAAEAIQRANAGGQFYAAFITLTYRDGVEWEGQHINGFLDVLREHYRRRGERLRYVWTAELTKRGRVHYHVMVWIPRGRTLPKPDRAGWWPYGSTQIAVARSPVGYLIKYASKGTDGDARFPKGCRIYGCGGLTLQDRQTKAFRLLPLYVRVAFNMGDGVRRLRGGGWVSTVTGEFMPAASLAWDGTAITVRYPDRDQNRSH